MFLSLWRWLRFIVHFHLECVLVWSHPRTSMCSIIACISASGQSFCGLQSTLQGIVLSSFGWNVPVGWWVVIWVTKLAVVPSVILSTATIVVRICSIRSIWISWMITTVSAIVRSIRVWVWMSWIHLVIKKRVRRRRPSLCCMMPNKDLGLRLLIG